MSQPSFSAAAVIGTGMMGPGIAVTLALGGVRTTLLSRSPEGASKGLEKARAQVRLLEENRLASADRAAAALASMGSSADFEEAVSATDIIIESAPEDLAFKQDLFARLDALAKGDAALATNTSGLSITAIAAKCSRPERVLTAHFWNPPHLMPLVEIVKGERTSDAVAAAVRDLLTSCGKVAVMVKKDRPGQLGNRLQMALWREAVHIVQEGIADAEDVDKAAKAGFGLRLPVYGIFEHADAVGLYLAHAVMDYTAGDLYSEPKAPPLLKAMIERGETGVRAGKGFYDWSKKSIDEVIARRDRFVLEMLRSGVVG